MKVGKPSQERIIVRVIETTIGTEGKKKGKITYKTFESFDVYEATPEKVYKILYDAASSAK